MKASEAQWRLGGLRDESSLARGAPLTLARGKR